MNAAREDIRDRFWQIGKQNEPQPKFIQIKKQAWLTREIWSKTAVKLPCIWSILDAESHGSSCILGGRKTTGLPFSLLRCLRNGAVPGYPRPSALFLVRLNCKGSSANGPFLLRVVCVSAHRALVRYALRSKVKRRNGNGKVVDFVNVVMYLISQWIWRRPWGFGYRNYQSKLPEYLIPRMAD
jgi:hypothetical protein